MRQVVAALLLFIAVLAPAAAQTYQIQVTWPVRLRASVSLDSPIVAKAMAGEVLRVVGRHNRWLKIERNGATAWLADWVDYTRLDQETAAPNTATGGGAPSDIDNCCFVNRRCATAQEWVDGYWAYQRNECQVSQPAMNGTASVSAPAGRPVDNCCFVNRQCASEQEWVGGYNAFQYDSTCQTRPSAPQSTGRFQCEAPSQSHSVGIFGSPEFKNKLGCALDLLKRKGGRWYNYVVSALRSIRPKGGTLITVYSNSREVHWGTDGSTYSSSDFVSLGAIMVHEACHVYYKESTNQVEEEIACTEVELQALDALGSSPGRRRTLMNRLENLREDPDLRWWGRH